MIERLKMLFRPKIPAGPFVPRLNFVTISYPKTGTTWFQFELARYLQRVCSSERLEFFDDPARLPACAHRDHPALVGRFTHDPLTWGDQGVEDLNVGAVVGPYVDGKVVLLIRHPLDTLVSHYMQVRHQIGDDPGELTAFIDHPVWGLDKLIRFYCIWHDHRGAVSGLYLRRYEDARREPHRVLADILTFLGETPELALVDDAVAFGSFDNMKRIESAGEPLVYRSSNLPVFGGGGRTNPDAFHVRKGEVGGYRSLLSAERVAELERRITEELPEWYGYR